MVEEHDPHLTCVLSWMRDAAADATASQLIELFERALGALWQRAQVTLGDITLAAIVDRVLYTAAARFPALGALRVEADGVRFDELRKSSDSLDQRALAQAIQFALVEFLTVLGHLTAEIMSSALHAELSGVTLGSLARTESERPAQLETARKKLRSS